MNSKPIKTSLKLPIVLMVGPPALLVLSFVLNGLSKSFETAPTDPNLFGQPTPASTILNVLVFVSAGFGLLAIVPCFFIGISMLFRRLRARRR